MRSLLGQLLGYSLFPSGALVKRGLLSPPNVSGRAEGKEAGLSLSSILYVLSQVVLYLNQSPALSCCGYSEIAESKQDARNLGLAGHHL